MSKIEKLKATPVNFSTTLQADVPKGRNGKHKGIVAKILSDLKQLDAGRALKIALSELPDTKQNVRSALNRATKQLGIDVATASDDDFLYVWNAAKANAD